MEAKNPAPNAGEYYTIPDDQVNSEQPEKVKKNSKIPNAGERIIPNDQDGKKKSKQPEKVEEGGEGGEGEEEEEEIPRIPLSWDFDSMLNKIETMNTVLELSVSLLFLTNQ